MSTTPTTPAVAEQCPSCAALLDDDQRYCLECGEPAPGARRPLPAALRRTAAPAEPVSAPPARAVGGSLAAWLAGLACLLLAVGVGVLIGRSGGEPAAAPPITISGAAAGAAPSAAAPVTFHSDWPAGRDGWTIALQALPKAGTDAAAVAHAKTAAAGQGAADVGALDSDAYRSLSGGSYVVYSGVFGARAEATAARARLAKTFGDARVVHVATTAPKAAPSAHAAAPKRASTAKRAKAGSGGGGGSTGSAFEKSKKLPKTLGTGGRPPAKDNKPAAGGSGFQEIK
jgi:hypothetical protein